MTHFPWAVLISVFVVGLAYLIKHFISAVVEEENDFLCVVGVFFVLYIGAAIAVGQLNPHISATQEDLVVSE